MEKTPAAKGAGYGEIDKGLGVWPKWRKRGSEGTAGCGIGDAAKPVCSRCLALTSARDAPHGNGL